MNKMTQRERLSKGRKLLMVIKKRDLLRAMITHILNGGGTYKINNFLFLCIYPFIFYLFIGGSSSLKVLGYSNSFLILIKLY